MGYEHIEITVDQGVGTLWLNRPEKRNALSEDMWADIPLATSELDEDHDVRVIVLAGRGSSFSVGIDLNMLASLRPEGRSQAEANMKLYREIKRLQWTAGALASARKPVIASIHGHCLGAGLDLVTACDLRVASADAVFSVRETKVGLVADVGSLQRLPTIVGAGATAEMAYTGADFDAGWALENGLINRLAPDHDQLEAVTLELAVQIAANSPIVVAGIKSVLAAADGRTIEEALDYVAQWNSSFLLTSDLMEALTAFMEKRDPDFQGH